jgi:uncharacterized protein
VSPERITFGALATVVLMRSAVFVLLAVALVACGDAGDAVTTTVPTSVDTVATSASPATDTATAMTTATSTDAAAATSPSTTSTGAAAATSPSTTASTTFAPGAVVPQGFDRVAATVTASDGTVCDLCLWVAATGDERALGLMDVTDLGGPDGMVFHYDSPTTSAFWMKDTVMPLSIAFFDQRGGYLDAFDMQPCTADPCPTYPTPTDFVDAIEVPQGMLDELGMAPGSVLAVSDLPCESDT